MPPKNEQQCKIGLDPIAMGKTFQKIDDIYEDICGPDGLKEQLKTQNGAIRNLQIDKTDEEETEKLRKRVQRNERWRFRIGGGLAVIIVIAGMIWKFVT